VPKTYPRKTRMEYPAGGFDSVREKSRSKDRPLHWPATVAGRDHLVVGRRNEQGGEALQMSGTQWTVAFWRLKHYSAGRQPGPKDWRYCGNQE